MVVVKLLNCCLLIPSSVLGVSRRIPSRRASRRTSSTWPSLPRAASCRAPGAALAPDVDQADLYHHTFHPDLPGFALVGVYHQSGPYFPTLELQARWVAYTWSGRRPAPTDAAMTAQIAALRPRRGPPPRRSPPLASTALKPSAAPGR